MPTGQQVANLVLTRLNLLGPNGNPSASDSFMVLNELNAMWAAWGIDEGLIWALIAEQYPLIAYQQSFSIGPGAGADWSTGTNPTPQRIYRASVVSAVPFTGTTQSTKVILVANTAGLYVGMRIISTAANGIQANTTILSIVANTSITVSIATTTSASGGALVATGLNRNPLEVVDEAEYISHNDLGASATTPDELYPKFAKDSNGNIRIYVFPVVNENQPSYVELEAAVPFATWALGTNYQIPDSYLDPICWAVTFRVMAAFGAAVNQQVAQIVTTEGEKAEARIREMNKINRQLPPTSTLPPGSQESAALSAASQGGPKG